MTCLALIVASLGLCAIALLERANPSAATCIAILVIAAAPLVLLGTQTRFHIVHDPHGPRLSQQFFLAGICLNTREIRLAPARTVLIAYEEYHVTSRSWILALSLALLGILPGFFYAYFLAGQRPQGDDEYGMQGPYEMHLLSLADADGNVLDTVELRRDEQVHELLRMITATVDADVERS